MVTAPAPAASGPPVITRELFKQHGRGCRVYNYGPEYEQVNSAALAKGISIKEELKNRGFSDFATFYKSCPRFRMLCWPSELADLGAGAVLYFHFIAFCMGFLLLAFLVQLPAMLEYYSADRIRTWNYDPNGFDSQDVDNCECLGRNEGQERPVNSSGAFSNVAYGTSCEAWDLSWCQMDSAGPFGEERGLWCCRRWCFASADCLSTKDADSPSRSNLVELHGKLVRSYTACEGSDLGACQTSSDMTSDSAYPLATFVEDTTIPANFIRVTGPGNLGPRQGGSTTVLLCYVIVLALFGVSVILVHQHQLRSIRVVDRRTTQPNDFAILVEGLPGTATDEKQIADFFREHAVKGKSDTEIAKVVIGWESKEYRENMRLKRSLQKKLLLAHVASNYTPCIARFISIEDPESVMKRLMAVQEKIRETAPDVANRLMSSGVVVVIFRHQADHRACLERWTSRAARLWYTDENGCMGLGRGDPLPKYFHRAIRIKRAPNPSNINWEDLGVPLRDRLKMFLKTNGSLVLLIAVCFFIVYGLEVLKESKNGAGLHWSILPVLGVSMCNALLMIACKQFGQHEYHNTLAEQTASQSLKMAVALVMNTAGIIFFKNAQPKEYYKDLVYDASLLFAVSAVMQPVIFLFDPRYILMGSIKRRNLTDEQLQEWNDAIHPKAPPQTKEEAMMMQKVKMQVAQQVEKMKEAFEPSELDTTKRYAYAVRNFLCCLLYSPLMPLILLVGIFGLAAQYWVDKYMLLRWYKRPKEPYSGEQAMLSLLFIRYTATLFFPVAVFIFLRPSWSDQDQTLIWFLVSLAGAVVYCLVPLSVARTLLCLRCLPGCLGNAKVEDDGGQSDDYYKVQTLWPKEMKYHKSQFLYKMVPELKNPENLKPGAYESTSVGDLRTSFSPAATGSLTTSTTGLSVGGSEPIKTHSTATVVVTDIGSEPTEPKPVPVSDPSDPQPGPAPDPVVPAVTRRVAWEYELDSGFTKFDDDAQGYIETKYKEWKAGGPKRINVHTCGISISLDFEKMTQKAGRHGRIRKIKREES